MKTERTYRIELDREELFALARMLGREGCAAQPESVDPVVRVQVKRAVRRALDRTLAEVK